MTSDPDVLVAALADDLRQVSERFADEKFMKELYRGLTNRVWRKGDGPDGHVSLSWGRAEELVNQLRAAAGEPALELEQTGGEGDLDATVAAELERLGWHSAPLNTDRHDDAHARAENASPPPKDASAPEWERQAHAEAHENAERRLP